jgi:hypothetical protein
MSYPRQNTIPKQNVSAAGAAASVTFTSPGTDGRWRLRYVVASYNGGAGPGVLTISDGAGVDWQVDVPTSVPLVLSSLDLQCGAGEAVTISLSAISGQVAKVNAYAVFE